MKQMDTFRKLMIAGACVAMFAAPALAQTATSTTTTDAAASTFGAPTASSKPKTATPRMIDEAQQRSQARSNKNRLNGTPEQWGSEEPFTYVPSPGIQ
jgi:hypothetical protein